MADKLSWRRTMLLALAVTIHNIPEGLAVGVGFGAIGTVRHFFYLYPLSSSGRTETLL